MSVKMEELLRHMVENGASDLHVKADNFPGFRVDGQIIKEERFGRLSNEQVVELAYSIMCDIQSDRFTKEKDLDFSLSIEDLARFRVNVLVQRGKVGMVIRQIPGKVPSADEIGLPEICREFARKPRGLVLVTGPTGSGKSTTLAAMIDYYNENESGHILTMEDPVEFMHQDKGCFVTQRQIGSDTESFHQGLRRALRQDPDVILIGELRDLETIQMAITAAETGHLVFGTLHTTSAISTVDRIIDVFPTDAQQQVRVQLSSTLQGVISQCLIKKIGGGRAAAHEILVATDAVRSLIREGKTPQLLNMLQTGLKHGMRTLESELVRLVNEGKISLDSAVAKANRPDDVAKTAQVPGSPIAQVEEELALAGASSSPRSEAPAEATKAQDFDGGDFESFRKSRR